MYEELRGNLMAQATHFSVHDETSLLLLKAADAIEELQKQLQKSEEDNANLTGWLAEEHVRAEEAKGKNMKYMLAVANQPRWIPVAERLPEEYGHYLANIEGGKFTQISWAEIVYFDGKIFRWEHISEEHPEEVTHWMQLPQPPESEGE